MGCSSMLEQLEGQIKNNDGCKILSVILKFEIFYLFFRFCLEDDAYIVNSVYHGSNYRPFKDILINSLKHKLLVYLYERAAYMSYRSKDPYELRRFYQYFDQVLKCVKND